METPNNNPTNHLELFQRTGRATWDEVWMNAGEEDRQAKKVITFMQICKNLSVLSHDQKVRVATIIVTDSFGEICAIGYNGDYSGGPNFRSNLQHGQSNFLHSEENALFHLGKPQELRKSLILLCTHKPCTMCAKRIVNSGIKRVIYDENYTDSLGQADAIFSSAGIKCLSMSDLLSSKETLNAYLQHALCKNV